MAVLVQYRCPDCHRDSDHWVTTPAPPRAECAGCGGPARRRFGGALLRGSGSVPVSGVVPVSGPESGHACMPDVPGTCTLIPTAARMLAARVRGDSRAMDREAERQTRAVADGTLNPAGSLQTLFAGGPTAST